MGTKTGRLKPSQKQNSKKQTQQGGRSYAAAPQRGMGGTGWGDSNIARHPHDRVVAATSEQRKRRQDIQRYGIIIAALIVVLGVAIALLMRESGKPGEPAAFQPSPHVRPGQPHDAYLTDPPTSGPHLDDLPSWRVSIMPIDKELLVHGLEDGGVVINYRPDLDTATVDRLATIATNYIEKADSKNRVVMAPYQGLTVPIALTAWRRIDRLSAFDEARIRRFVDEYIGIDHHREAGNHSVP